MGITHEEEKALELFFKLIEDKIAGKKEKAGVNQSIVLEMNQSSSAQIDTSNVSFNKTLNLSLSASKMEQQREVEEEEKKQQVEEREKLQREIKKSTAVKAKIGNKRVRDEDEENEY